jgi:hypothetical protein
MKWYKHDSNAHMDAKLRKVRIKYGMEGYGLYWYCLELIAQEVDEHNLSFELEHDAEIIGYDTNIDQERVQEMMETMCNLGLFENKSGVITCLKMAKRLDQSMTSNPKMRGLIASVRKNHDNVMTTSCQNHDGVMQDKTRLDKTRNNRTVINNTNAAEIVAGEFAQFGIDLFKPSPEDMAYCEDLELAEPFEIISAHFRIHHGELMTLATESHWSRLFRGWVEKNKLPSSFSNH